MPIKPTISISNTKRARILHESKRSLLKTKRDIPLRELIAQLEKVEEVSEIIASEMIGSKNKYLIDLANELGHNKR